MPAPPLESEPAMVSATGVVMGRFPLFRGTVCPSARGSAHARGRQEPDRPQALAHQTRSHAGGSRSDAPGIHSSTALVARWIPGSRLSARPGMTEQVSMLKPADFSLLA